MSKSDSGKGSVETGFMWFGILLGLSGLESGWQLGWFEAGMLATIGFGLALAALVAKRRHRQVTA